MILRLLHKLVIISESLDLLQVAQKKAQQSSFISLLLGSKAISSLVISNKNKYSNKYNTGIS